MTGLTAKRVLLVSYWFPPFSAVASLRMGKLAKHLFESGWDVRVLAADATDAPTMPLEIPKERVVYAPWTDVDRVLENALGDVYGILFKRKTIAAVQNETDGPSAAVPDVESKLRTKLRLAYLQMVRWPDNRAGWTKPAVEAGNNLIASWRPSVIYATAPPVTSLIVADRLSRRHGVPWVAEFRDPWGDNPYYEYSSLRRVIDRIWERRLLSRAAAIVSVSPIWERKLFKRFGPPTITAMNGFVLEDYPQSPPVEPETAGPLRIVYTGHIYTGHRDPAPLFAAIKALNASPSDVVVEFIGTELEAAVAAATAYGVQAHVKAHPPVPYRRALELQLRADVLLHMQWCHPTEEGTIAGKIFDYFGARRPILGIALEDSMVAEMINTRGAGLATNDVSKIAEQVARWIRMKNAGSVPPLPVSASAGLERSAQLEKIRALLDSIA